MMYRIYLLLYLPLPLVSVAGFLSPHLASRKRSGHLYAEPDLKFYVNFPEVKVPNIEMPTMPAIDMPTIPSLEKIDLPSMPTLDIPSLEKLDIPSVGGVDHNILVPAVGLAVVAIVAASAGGGSSGATTKAKKKKKKNVYEIPYHAAARLAYDKWLEAHPDETYDEAAYLSFQRLYEEQAVAEATAKKLARDLQGFANEPIPEPVVRQIPERETVAVPPKGRFFFAN